MSFETSVRRSKKPIVYNRHINSSENWRNLQRKKNENRF